MSNTKKVFISLTPEQQEMAKNLKHMKKENLPPVGTKVFDFQFGRGIINSNDENENYPILVEFLDYSGTYTFSGKELEQNNSPTLSLTEYDLINGGFTPISEWNKPKAGDVGYFWDSEDWKDLYYSVLFKINQHDVNPYTSFTGASFKNFSTEIPEWYKAKIEEIREGLKK